MTIALVALQFIVLQTLDGRNVHVNPSHVVSLGESPDQRRGVFPEKVHCIVAMLDGKFITVEENCDSVRRRLEEAK